MTGSAITRDYKRLREFIGRNVAIETKDGIHREGRITGVEFTEMEFMGGSLALPETLEINGDPMDRIEFKHIAKVKEL